MGKMRDPGYEVEDLLGTEWVRKKNVRNNNQFSSPKWTSVENASCALLVLQFVDKKK